MVLGNMAAEVFLWNICAKFIVGILMNFSAKNPPHRQAVNPLCVMQRQSALQAK
jgi:hypothetical protein